jgi:hypothetical protein
LFVAALAVAGLAVKCRGSVVREEYVAGQNAFGHDDIRFSSEGAWAETLVIFDDRYNLDESDAEIVANNAKINSPMIRAGFRYVRVGNFVRRIQ